MGGKNDSPPPPDYEGAARAQAEASREITEQQTVANRPTQITPWGTVSWDREQQWDPATGQMLNEWTQRVELTPEQQAALDAQQNIQQGRSELAQSLLGRAQDEFGDQMDWSQFTPMGVVPTRPDYAPADYGGATQIDDPQLQMALQLREGPQGVSLARMGAGPTLQGGPQGTNLAAQQGPSPLQLQRGPGGVDFSGVDRPDTASLQDRINLTGAQQVEDPEFQRGLDFSGAPDVAGMDFSDAYGVGNPQGYVDTAEQAIYNRATSRLDPMFQDREADMDNQLRNQGLQPGDEAYDRAMRNLNFARNDAYSSAINDAIMRSGAEGSRLFGMDVTRRGIDTGEEAQARQFDLARRGQSVGEEATAGQFANQAAQGLFGAQLAERAQDIDTAFRSGEFGNAAQLASFGMGMQGAGFDRDTAMQRFQAAQQGVGQNNQAAQAEFGAAMEQARMGDTRALQDFQSQLQAAGFNNEQIQQMFQNAMAGTGFNNQAAMQEFGAAGQGADRFNQAQLQEAGFGNEAQRQQFLMQAQQRGMDVNEANQLFNQSMQAGNLGFNQDMQSANFATQLRQQQIAEEMQRRGFSLNEINSILTGQQVSMPNQPNFNAASRSETPQLLNAADMGFQANMDIASMNNANFNSMLSGAAGVAGLFAPGV